MKRKKKKALIRERIANFRRKIYRWLMQLAVSRGYRKPITYGFGYSELLKAWKTGDVIFGDLIYISKRIYIIAGMNKYGGPGQPYAASLGTPTPEFIPANPQERRIYQSFDIFRFPPWSKIGHRTKEEWEQMRDDTHDRMMPVAI